MRGIVFEDVQQVAVSELPDPELQHPGDAVVQVEVAGLCGSDLHPYFGREAGLDAGTVMGHELVGRVLEVGSAVQRFGPGDRVACAFTTSCGACFYCRSGLTARCQRGQLLGWRQAGEGLHGAQAEQVRIPFADHSLMAVPVWMEAETALLVGDNLSTAWFAVESALAQMRTSDAAEDTLLVIGCGTVGLLAVTILRRCGFEHIVALDPHQARSERARALGAIAHTDAEAARRSLAELTSGRGADAVLEFVGLPEAQRVAYQLVRPGGSLSAIGCNNAASFAFSPSEAYDKNLTIRTGRCPARAYMDRLVDQLRDQPMDLSWCVTHRFPLEAGIDAYRTFAGRAEGCLKAVIEFANGAR